VGTLTVVAITFAEIPIGSWDSGLIALVPNLIVLGVVEFAVRARRRHTGISSAAPALVSDPA
jgi:SSS family solute:Na+ symporter